MCRRSGRLRVDDYRVFYDVDGEGSIVIVRAVRLEGRRTTEVLARANAAE